MGYKDTCLSSPGEKQSSPFRKSHSSFVCQEEHISELREKRLIFSHFLELRSPPFLGPACARRPLWGENGIYLPVIAAQRLKGSFSEVCAPCW